MKFDTHISDYSLFLNFKALIFLISKIYKIQSIPYIVQMLIKL